MKKKGFICAYIKVETGLLNEDEEQSRSPPEIGSAAKLLDTRDLQPFL